MVLRNIVGGDTDFGQFNVSITDPGITLTSLLDDAPFANAAALKANVDTNWIKLGRAQGGVIGVPSSTRRFNGDIFELYSRERIDQKIKSVALTGGVRLSAEWFEIEKTAGVYDLADLKATCKLLFDNKIPVHLSIFNQNNDVYPGYNGANFQQVIIDINHTDAANQRVVPFWQAILDELGDYIQFVSFENEYDVGSNMNGKKIDENGVLLDPEQAWTSIDFADYFTQVVTKFKQMAATSGKVLLAGGPTATNKSMVDRGFSVDEGLDNGWLTAFDVFYFNIYSRPVNQNRYFIPEAIFRDLKDWNDKLESRLGPGEYITMVLPEQGYAASLKNHGMPERNQAGFNIRQHLWNQACSDIFPRIKIVLATQYHVLDVLPWIYNLHNSANPADKRDEDDRYGLFMPTESYDSEEPWKLRLVPRAQAFAYNEILLSHHGWEYQKMCITNKQNEIIFRSDSIPADQLKGYECQAYGNCDIHIIGDGTTATPASFIAAQDVRYKLEWTDIATATPVSYTADVSITNGMTFAEFLAAIRTGFGSNARVTTTGSNRLVIRPISYGAPVTLTITDQADAELSQTWKENLAIRASGGTEDIFSLTRGFEMYNKGSISWLYRMTQGSYSEGQELSGQNTPILADVNGTMTRGTPNNNGLITRTIRDELYWGMVHFWYKNPATNAIEVLSYEARDWRHGRGALSYVPFAQGTLYGRNTARTPDMNNLAGQMFSGRTFSGTALHKRVGMVPQWIAPVEVA